MGIEEVQKVNALARELMRHGIAQTSDEAMIRAGEMLRANGVNSMTAAISSHSLIGKSEEAIVTNETLSGLNMDIRSLGVRFEAVVREVLTLRDEIKKLGGGLSDMNRVITRMSVQQPHEQFMAPAAEQHVAAEAAPAAPVQQAFAREAVQPVPQFERPRAAAARPKEEQYKPEDVAIEKIFYFGK
ncbi:hypothetical protein HYU20_03095 [Candidatus Woesearchaeota archaeon]|nr:hypothetical protein [Candidatus Woesearchaeota archaeon]